MDRKWWTLVASCIAIFMLLLDVMIVNASPMAKAIRASRHVRVEC